VAERPEPLPEPKGQILLVDDSTTARLLLGNGLKGEGWEVTEAESGKDALRLIRRETYDAVVCDLQMPELDGFAVLAEIKQIDSTVPVVAIADGDQAALVLRAVREGAFDVVNKKGGDRRHLLGAVEHAVAHGKMLRENLRLNMELEMRVAEVEEQKKLILEETEKSERLLNSILPRAIAEKLKGRSLSHFAERYQDVTVLFADISGFSGLAAGRSAGALIDLLDAVFNIFDDLVDRHGCEKIKTIGDAYMAAAGVPIPHMDHAQVVADLALDMIAAIRQRGEELAPNLDVRIGINSGPVIAGVIGRKKPIFDLWGETVNLASRMEAHGIPGKIQVAEGAFRLLERSYRCEERGVIEVKGHPAQRTWFLTGKKGRASKFG